MVFKELARSFWYFLGGLAKEKSHLALIAQQPKDGNKSDLESTCLGKNYGKKSRHVNLICTPHVHHQEYMERKSTCA
jgi:hypothetical protein